MILEFRKLPGVTNYCRYHSYPPKLLKIIPSRYILEHSQVPVVQFQAISTLRDAVIREWAAMSDDSKDNMRTYLISYALQHPLEKYVEKQLLQTIAVMAKRGWMHGEISRQIQFRYLTGFLGENIE